LQIRFQYHVFVYDVCARYRCYRKWPKPGGSVLMSMFEGRKQFSSSLWKFFERHVPFLTRREHPEDICRGKKLDQVDYILDTCRIHSLIWLAKQTSVFGLPKQIAIKMQHLYLYVHYSRDSRTLRRWSWRCYRFLLVGKWTPQSFCEYMNSQNMYCSADFTTCISRSAVTWRSGWCEVCWDRNNYVMIWLWYISTVVNFLDFVHRLAY
jgi:hypothetical protein